MVYCVTRAEEDLSFPLVVVENSDPETTEPVLYTLRLSLDYCAHRTGKQQELSIYLSVIFYFKENPGRRQLNVSHMKQEVPPEQRQLQRDGGVKISSRFSFSYCIH